MANTDKVFLKTPPSNLEAELAVLSSMLLDKDGLNQGLEKLDKYDFYSPAHQFTFACMEELFLSSIPVDLITLSDKLVEKGVFEQIGGLAYLTKLSTTSATSANISHHINIVEEKSLLRKLISVSSEINQKSYEEKENVSSIIEFAEKNIFNIIQDRKSGEFVHIKELLMDSFDKIEEASKTMSDITGISTGFTDLDFKTAGLQKSDLILIAARPSMGKSALALNIAQHAASNKHSVAIFSLEMSNEQLVNRMLCTAALVDAQKLRTGNLDKDDWLNIVNAMSPLAKSNIYFDDTPGISVSEVRAKCRRLKLEKGLDLIIIDYLQLMSGSGRNDSRQQEISEISRSLKSLAREMDAPVLALSQLSRAPEQRKNDHRPILSDLRDSGAIEQDADIVAFIYRDEYYYPDTEKKNIAELIIAKQRNGPTGTIELAWLSQYAKFANLQKSFYG